LKRIFTLCYFIILLVTIISLSAVPQKEYFHANALSKANLPETQTAALVQVWNLVRFSFPSTDYASGRAFKTNLTPLVGRGFIHIRQISSAKQRILAMKQVVYCSGFCFATMIISLFYCFYRSFGGGFDSDYFNYNIS
jgi:hypothetical protein